MFVQRQPRPMQLETSIREDAVGEHRNLYCYHYDRCLDVCVQEGWNNWTCAGCSLKNEGQPPQVTGFANARRRDPFTSA